jgi:hypothetical protein
MSPARFAAVIFSAALFLLVGVVVLGRDCARQIVGDFLSLPDFARQIRDAETSTRELGGRSEVARQRIDEHARISQAVLQHRLTLREAAGAFRELDRTLPSPFQADVLHHTPGNADEEWYARQVIGWVQGGVRERPDEVSAAIPRLQAELDEMLHRAASQDSTLQGR